MSIQALKIDIIHWLTEVNDEHVLEKIQAIRENTEGTALSSDQKKDLSTRFEKYESGSMEFRTWKETKNSIRKRYKDAL